MERKEIDILMEAARKGCAVVEKTTHLVWSLPELVKARWSGLYLQLTRLLPPDGEIEISSVYPGCLQMTGRGEAGGYRPVGQTEHFVICAPDQWAEALQFLAGK